VEEQFYLLWPAVLLVFGPRHALFGAAGFAIAVPFVRVATWFLVPDARATIGESFGTTADAIATGCLLAGCRARFSEHSGYVRFRRSRAFFAVVLVVLICALVQRHTTFDALIGAPLMNVGIALILDRCMAVPDDALGRALNRPWLAWFGTLSYSLYLWQQPFLNRHSTAWQAHFPRNVPLAIGASIVSFYWVERPCLRLRERLEPLLFRSRLRAKGDSTEVASTVSPWR
jgi:peptidoglycan/LPS O-acetylase OafA/YrhL